MRDNKTLQLMANSIRMLSADAVAKANSGHPGMPMGMADIVTVLFSEYLKYDVEHPKWADRDRFILSNGHGSMLLYSLLYLTGYEDCSLKEIKNFRQLHSKTAGHPEYGLLEGIETTTGPLGQGAANAVGMAIAERHLNARFGDDLVDHRIYCAVGDGCLMEGISYEALSLAGHLKLKKLCILFDDNQITIDGSTNLSRSENMRERMQSIGFDYFEANGHDFDDIREALSKARQSEKPSFIAFKTVIGFGSPTQEGTSGCHGSPIKGEDLELVRKRLNWEYKPFEIPARILNEWRICGTKGKNEYSKWRKAFLISKQKNEFERLMEGNLTQVWEEKLSEFKAKTFLEKPKEATRISSGRVLEILTEIIPEMVGGSADLTGSVKTKTKSASSDLTKDNYGGRYINYGIREHAMAGIMNGMALHGGVIPYAGTFLCFLDYMKPAVRLSALMQQRVIYVLTHDSIGLGEDGPTHQPVEHLSMLRAIPNLNTFRPCNIQETIECYEIALKSKNTPSAIVLSRQDIPFLSAGTSEKNYCEKGAYIFSNTALGVDPDVTIIATGSEISLALEVKKQLHQYGFAVRVISAPCLELFDKQSVEYKKEIWGSEKTVKIAIEASSCMGWYKYIDYKGLFFGIVDSFGISAPAKEVYEEFGLTAENIAPKVKEAVIKKRRKLARYKIADLHKVFAKQKEKN
jgi:transketolase